MRTFLIVWLGQLVSLVGSGLTGFALGVHVYQTAGSTIPLALVWLCVAVPRILASLLGAGPLVDGVIEPLMAEDRALAGSAGLILGTGPGRGIGLVLVIAGVLNVLAALATGAYLPYQQLDGRPTPLHSEDSAG